METRDIKSRLLEMADSPEFEETPTGKLMFEAAAELSRLRAENERLRKALEPFALTADWDIGDTEDDTEPYRPMPARLAAAGVRIVGDFRRARKALEGE